MTYASNMPLSVFRLNAQLWDILRGITRKPQKIHTELQTHVRLGIVDCWMSGYYGKCAFACGHVVFHGGGNGFDGSNEARLKNF